MWHWRPLQLGPTSTTQRPLSSFLIACLAHNAALERTRRALLPLILGYTDTCSQSAIQDTLIGARGSKVVLSDP